MDKSTYSMNNANKNPKPDKLNVCLYMAISVNGCIATTDERTPWSEEVWDSYHKIVSRFKNMIVGRRTYEIMKEVNEFETLKNPITLVITSDKAAANYNNIVFVSTPELALKELAERNFSTALVAGGSRLNQAFLQKGLINEIYLDIEPFIFGNGLPLFSPSKKELNLSLQSVNRIGKNTVQLHYHCLN
jgi:dihydrofolate reductase